MAAPVFWALAGLIGYTYVGYPLLMALLARLRPRPVRAGDWTPPVTVIVTAYNEEASIAAKLDCLLAQDYPADRLEVLVASDGSTDATDRIVQGHAHRGVRLLRVEGRQGKTETQNQAAKAAGGEVLVFTDATTHLAPDAVRAIVRPFADPEVGCVGGRLTYVSRGGTRVGAGGTGYWQYERGLKRLESRVGSLIGVSGCFYAVRTGVYRPIAPHLISDFVVALDTVESGHRVVYEERAQSFEETLERGGREFAMRVRVAVRSYGALWEKRRLLNPFRHGLYAVQLLSHKVLRYAVPLFLLGVLGTNALLLGDGAFYRATFAVQALFYGAAAVGFAVPGKGKAARLLSKPSYFVLANLAALAALVQFLRGKRMVTWTPVRSP